MFTNEAGAVSGRLERLTLDAVLDGWVRVTEMDRSGATCRLVLCRQDSPSRGLLSVRERSVIRRLALGQCQKLVAYDFGLAHTTVSSHLRGALDKLGLTRWEHAVLVAAAIEVGGDGVRPVDEDVPPAGAASTAPGPFYVVRTELSLPGLLKLTEAEREVALLVVDGYTNAEIGAQRRCSPRTVANQISAVFRKLRVHGRCELIRSLVLSGPSTGAVSDCADIAPQSTGRRLGAVDREASTGVPIRPAAVG